jgi:hypothetical protein
MTLKLHSLSSISKKGRGIFMPTTVIFECPRDYVGQIVDGLEVLIEQWQATAEYLNTGESDADVCIRECSDAREAESIAERYREIRGFLVNKLKG